jgi:hypothetical protein
VQRRLLFKLPAQITDITRVPKANQRVTPVVPQFGRTRVPLWVTSGCAGPPAARQVNLNKRTPNSSALTWRSVTRRPDDNVLDLLS